MHVRPAARSAAKHADNLDSARRRMTRAVALAEGARQFGLGRGEQAQARRSRRSFLCRIRSQVAPPAVGPSLACTHQLGAQIVAVGTDVRQAAPVIIMASDRHLYLLVQHPPLQHLARCLATSLADLGRVDALNAQLARRPSGVRAHPERVTIGDKGNLAGKDFFRIGRVACDQERRQQKKESPADFVA